MAKQVAKKFDANEFLTRHMSEVTTMTPSEYLEKNIKGFVAPVKSPPMSPLEVLKQNQERLRDDRDRDGSKRDSDRLSSQLGLFPS